MIKILFAGLGNVAAEGIMKARQEEKFMSIDDLKIRSKVGDSVTELLRQFSEKMRTRVPVLRISRSVCAGRNPRGESSQGNQFFQVMKKWKRIRVLRALNFEFLKEDFKRRVKNGEDRQTYYFQKKFTEHVC